MTDIRSRLFHDKLYNSPGFKSKYWHDTEVYSEQTPLLAENIDKLLNKFCDYSHTYETLEDYYENCKFKSLAPQVVGLEELNHWVAVYKEGSTYKFIDSSGAPKAAYYEYVKDLPTNFDCTEAGKMRQSPKSNACGLYAAFYCLGQCVYNMPYYFWDAYASRIVNFNSESIEAWRDAYRRADSDHWLHLNDIAMYGAYKMLV